MHSRQDGHTRTARIRANRRMLLGGLVISAGLHGWAFAALTLAPVDLSRTTGVPERVTMQPPPDFSAIEVIQAVPVREEFEPPPLPAEELPVIAAAAPERNPEPTARNAELGSLARAAQAGSPGAPGSVSVQSPDQGALASESAPPLTFAELLESAMGDRPAVALTSQFAAQRPLEGQAPIEAVVVDPHAGHDHVKVEDGSLWGTVWRRMGKTFGFGGDLLCIPKPAARVVSR